MAVVARELTSAVGISTPEQRIGTYKEFTRDLLPRIKKLGYNTIQLMYVRLSFVRGGRS